MPDGFDPESGEIIESAPTTGLPRMPAEIAKAILTVMKAAKRLGTDSENTHARYSYVSIDKFLETFGPLMAEAGLIMLTEETSVEVRAGGKEGSAWLFPKYEVWLVHESGAMWGPLHRHLALPVTGPQTFGAAESYVQKRVMRALFMVPTGDRDADDTAEDRSVPASGNAVRRSAPAAASEQQQTQGQKAWYFLRDKINAAETIQSLYLLDPKLIDGQRVPAWDVLKKEASQHYAGMVKRWDARKAALSPQEPEQEEWTA